MTSLMILFGIILNLANCQTLITVKYNALEYLVESEDVTVKVLRDVFAIPEDSGIFLVDSNKVIYYPTSDGVFDGLMTNIDYIINDNRGIGKSCKFDRKWTLVGNLNDLDDLIKEYPLSEWEYGVTYNAGYVRYIQPMRFNSWNRGLVMSSKEFYPIGDDSKKFKLGYVVFSKGKDNYANKDVWYHEYYYDGTGYSGYSNGVSNPNLYVRRN